MHFLEAFDFNKRTSLYVHVPFCKSKCSYCAFYSKICTSNEINQYCERLVKEISSVVDKMNGRHFYTAFIGGGNPGCLSVFQLERICELICQNGRPEEFTIEMNPESLSKEHFFLFEKYITRLSMGVQSLNEKALKFLGRNADTDQTKSGMQLALSLREKKGTQISFDMITCLPKWHDSLSDVKELVVKYSPDHISLYALTLEENTPLYLKKPVLPDSDEQTEILNKLWQYLEMQGYVQYEVSNFARENLYSRHNSVYWDYEQYVGLGPAAASTGFVGDKIYRVESDCNIANYNYGDIFSGYSITGLTEGEALEEFVLMGLRHFKGLNLERLEKEFNKTLTICPIGYSISNGFLIPDKNGILIADWAASEVLLSLDS